MLKGKKQLTVRSDADITQEQFDGLFDAFTEQLEAIGPALHLLLYSTHEGKNFLSFSFKNETEGESDGFDLVLRKHGSDSAVVCPLCARDKRVKIVKIEPSPLTEEEKKADQ